MTRPIILVGAGGHAVSCIDVVEEQGEFRIAGLVASSDEVGSEVLGYAVIGDNDSLREIFSSTASALVAVGQIKTAAPRVRLFEQLQGIGYHLPVMVSPRAYVSRHARVGAGTVVMHGAVVNANAIIGSNCIINSHALIEHDASIGDHCHVSTAAVVNGGVHVGERTFLGSCSVVREGASIGDEAFVAMGQRVVGDYAAGTRSSDSLK